jgi:uncharacterized DUF497 family protein
MDFFRVLWDLEDDPDGNLQHIFEHGVTADEVEQVLRTAVIGRVSRSSGRPLAFGYTDQGRLLAVVFEWIDEDTICPVTAYDVEDGL